MPANGTPHPRTCSGCPEGQRRRFRPRCPRSGRRTPSADSDTAARSRCCGAHRRTRTSTRCPRRWSYTRSGLSAPPVRRPVRPAAGVGRHVSFGVHNRLTGEFLGDLAGIRERLLREADRPLDEVVLKSDADLAQVRAERRIITSRDETVVALDVDVLHTGARQLLGFALAPDGTAPEPGEREVRTQDAAARQPLTPDRILRAVHQPGHTGLRNDLLVADPAALRKERAVRGAFLRRRRLRHIRVRGLRMRACGKHRKDRRSRHGQRLGVSARPSRASRGGHAMHCSGRSGGQPPTCRLTCIFMQFSGGAVEQPAHPVCDSNGMLWALLRKYARPYRWLLTVVAVFQLISTLASLYLPTVNAAIIDDGVAKGDSGRITELGGLMLAVTAGQVVCAVGAVYFGSRAGMGFGRDLRSAMFHHVTGLSAEETAL